MKAPVLPLHPAIGCFAFGYFFAAWFPNPTFSWFPSILIGVMGTAIVLFIKPKQGKGIKTVLLYALFFGIGVSGYQSYYRLPGNHFLHHTKSGITTLGLRIDRTVSENSFSRSYYAQVENVGSVPTKGRILLRHLTDTLRLPSGTKITLRSALKPLPQPRNPGAFDYRAYLNNLRIYATIDLKDNNYSMQTKSNRTWKRQIARFKNRLSRKLSQTQLSDDAKGMIHALVMGNRKALDRELVDQYAQAGIIHILAISGLHIGILVVLLSGLFRPLLRLPHGRWVRFALLLLFLWGFAFFTGLSASVVRAVSMFSFLTLAQALGTFKNSLHFLWVSFFVLLLAYPPFFKSIGFQMSYLAVFGILWFWPVMQRWWQPKPWFLKKLWDLTGVCLTAQLAVAPLSVYYFHQFPGLFLLSNWVILPFFSAFLMLCIVLTALLTVTSLPPIFTLIFNQTVAWMNQFIGWIAQQEAFFFDGIVTSTASLFLIYGFIGMILLYLKTKRKIPLYLALIGLIGLQCIAFLERQKARAINALWILHEYEKTVLVHHKNKTLYVFENDGLPETARALQDFKQYAQVKKVESLNIQNFYIEQQARLLIVDTERPYDKSGFIPTHILLKNNPKINVERLLTHFKPMAVIADGSNAPWMVARWKATCAQKGIAFHDTRKDGAYKINL